MALFTALMVLFALVIPFAGNALAEHGNERIADVELSPDEDTAALGVCNEFTASAEDDDGDEAEGETLDIRVEQEFDEDDETPELEFCDPGSTEADDVENEDLERDQDAGDPESDTAVLTGECLTDEDGDCTFGIRSDTEGDAEVTAFAEADQNDSGTADDDEVNNDEVDDGEPSDTSTKTFTDEEGTGLDCTPEQANNPEGTEHEFECSLENEAGDPTAGTRILFEIVEGPNEGEEGDCGLTDDDADDNDDIDEGEVECRYTDDDDDEGGTDEIVVFADRDNDGNQDDSEPTDTIFKTFTGVASIITCGPDGASVEENTTQTVTCTVTDAEGETVQGVVVVFETSGQGRFLTETGNCTGIGGGFAGTEERCRVTDENGQATVQVTSTEAGTQTVTGGIFDEDPDDDDTDEDDTACEDVDNDTQFDPVPQDDAPAGTRCEDTATITYTEDEPTPTQCNDGIDNDGDTRIDFPNDRGCASLEDNTESPDPDDDDDDDDDGPSRVATNLTIRYDRDAGAFKGAAGSSRKTCQTGRTVLLKKVTPGPNRTVGRDTTNRQGNWRIGKRRARGRFYAVVLRQTATGRNGAQFNCLRDRSVTIKVGRRR